MSIYKGVDDNESNRKTDGNGAIPRFLGNEGKSEEISRIFATILDRGYDKRNEVQGTVSDNWLDTVELLAKEQGIWIYWFNKAKRQLSF